MTRRRLGAVALGLALVLAGCLHPVAPRTAFLGDLSGLQRVPGTEAAPVWRRPGADLGRYDKVVLDPIEVRYTGDPAMAARAAAEIARLKAYFRQAAMLAVSDGYTVVGDAGPNVLRVRAAVTGLRVAAPRRATDGQPLDVALIDGRARLEAELRDSTTGTRLAALLARRDGISETPITSREAAESAFDSWAKLLSARLAALKSMTAH